MNKTRVSALITELERVSVEEPSLFNAQHYAEYNYSRNPSLTLCAAGIFVRSLPYFREFCWNPVPDNSKVAHRFYTDSEHSASPQLLPIKQVFMQELELPLALTNWIVLASYEPVTLLAEIPITKTISALRHIHSGGDIFEFSL